MKTKNRRSDEAARDQSRSGGGLWRPLQPQQEVTCTRLSGQGCLLVHLVEREKSKGLY